MKYICKYLYAFYTHINYILYFCVTFIGTIAPPARVLPKRCCTLF